MTLLKWLASFTLTLLLLLAVAIIVLPKVVDPNDYREKITTLVKQKTGRDLVLAGDLSISVFPWLGIRTQGLTLSQPPAIGGEMLSVDTAQLRVKLLPLMSKRVEVDTVVLESPTVRLITLKSGENSFSGLAGDQTDTQAANQSDPAAAIALVIQGLELSDGDLLWDDQQAEQRYQVKNLNVATGNLIGAELASLDASGTLIDASADAPTDFDFSGLARIDTETLLVYAEDLDVQLQQGEQQLEFQLANAQIDHTQGARLKNIQLSADVLVVGEADAAANTQPKPGKAKLTASIVDANLDFISGQLNAIDTDAKVSGTLPGQPAFDINASLPNFTMNAQNGEILANSIDLIGQIGDRDFALEAPRLSANFQAQIASLESLNINSEDLVVAFDDLKVSQFIDQPRAQGNIKLQPFNAAKLIKDLEIDYKASEPSALQTVAFNSRFDASMQKLSMQQMQLTLDQSQLNGSFAVNDFENLALQFDLALDQLNLDHYLPMDEESPEADASDAAALAVPMAILKDINANGSFKAGQLISGGLQLNDIDVLVVSTPGNLTITPKASLYDGSLDGQMAFNESNEQSTLKVKNQIDLVSLAKFLTAADVTDQLSGIGSVDLDIDVTERNGVQNNSGTIKLLAKNGAIKGVDIKGIVDQAYQTYNTLAGKELDEEAQEGETKSNDETRFAEMLGTFYLKDNRLSNDDFVLKAPLFRISGEGDIDLAGQTLNYLVHVSIVNSSEGQGGKALEELRGLTIPIRFRGALAAPSYSLDTKALYQGLAKREIEKKKSEYLEEKLGIEDGGTLSTKEILEQVLINKVEEKTRKDEPAQQREVAQPDIAQPPTNNKQPEQAATQQSKQASQAVPDVSADPNAASEPEEEKSAEDELKDELKKRLLDSIFNL